MKLSKEKLALFACLAIVAIALLTLAIAPAKNTRNSGSTFNRSPDGYGAWYAFMSERGTPVERWQKPFENLANNPSSKPPVTLLRVHSSLIQNALSLEEEKWVEKGNILVNLGVKEPVTTAPFSTLHNQSVGDIKIDTARRQQNVAESLLSDRFGALVWENKIGKGRAIFAVTPYLAANAYQNFQGNYELLAQLVSQSESNSNKPTKIWVDEYLHGYKDAEIIKKETGKNIFSYLAKTPLLPACVQGIILLAIAIFAQNRRFGQSTTLSTPIVDNNKAYIQALASVLEKANSTDFVLEVLGKEEQLQLQKALLLGQVPLDRQFIVDAWVQQTGRSPTELEEILQMPSQKRRIGEKDLLMWLNKWEQIRSHLPHNKIDP